MWIIAVLAAVSAVLIALGFATGFPKE